MNKLAIVAATLLLIFGGALWFLASVDWNGYVRSQIESVGSKLTDNAVTVDKVDMQLAEGSGGVYGVAFANPNKYQQSNALYLGEISVDIDIDSLSKQVVIIETAQLIKPTVFVEFDQNGANNISELLNNINRKFDNQGKPNDDVHSEPPVKRREQKDQQERRIIIENLVLNELALTVDLTQLNGKTLNITLPNSQLSHIGGTEGVPASQLGAVVIQQVFKQISKEAKKQFEHAAKQQAKDTLKDALKDKAKRLFDKLSDKQDNSTQTQSETGN